MTKLLDGLPIEDNEPRVLTYCEYAGAKVKMTNSSSGCEHGECKSCKLKEEYYEH